MNKLTKGMIEQFAYEVMDYLVKAGLDTDVCIYYNNKRMLRYKGKTEIKDNIDPHDHFKYAAYDHILSMSFEGPLYDVLNYGSGAPKMYEIFQKYGCYWELGNAWNLTACIDRDIDVEFTRYKRSKINHIWYEKPNVPIELQSIMEFWFKSSQGYGDHGSCVIGAGFEFEYNGNKYFMSACSPWQGSLSWESSIGVVEQKLIDIGASEIIYKWGNMD